MAYITLEELKEILPEIMRDWIDKDDESWEWIFQVIEQKCHVGKRLKGKKWKKKLQSTVDTHSTVLSAHRNDINELTKKIDELKRYVTDNLSSRINVLSNSIEAAKTMAETAKRRTEVDYTKYSKEVKELNGMTKEQNNKEAEVDHTKWPFADAVRCESCKHISKGSMDQPCVDCRYNGINIGGMDKWEAKDAKEINHLYFLCQTCKHVDQYPNCPDCGNNYSAWEAKENE